MATRVQKRRGSPSDHTSFTSGAVGEVTVEMPTVRGSGSSQEYAALYVHHGDGAVGDRIASETEMKNTTRTVVDEQKFLAKIKGFRSIDDDSLTANPDILHSRWEYEWQEISLSGGDQDVTQVATLTVASGSTGGTESKNIILPTDIYGKTVSINFTVPDGNQDAVASAIHTAISGDTTHQYTSSYTSGATVTLTAKIKGRLLTPTTDITLIGVTGAVTTEGSKYSLVTGTTGDLGRTSDPGGDGTHEFAAINIAELQNDAKFIGPGIGNGTTDIPLQSVTGGVWPTNYKVIPVGGSSTYDFSSSPYEPITTSDTTQADRFRNTAVEYVVEMTERRKLNPGTGSGQTVGTANASGFNCFYYFNVPNAISGPC